MPSAIDEQITGVEYVTDCATIDKIFYSCMDHIDLKEQTHFLEQFFSIYPLHRVALLSIYFKGMAEFGNSKLAHEAGRIYVETTERLASIGQGKFNCPLVVDDNNFLLRLGEANDQVALTYAYIELGKLREKPVIYSPTALVMANSALAPYVADSFEVIVDPSLNVQFNNFKKIAPYSPFLYKFSDSQYGHSFNFFIDCHKDLVARGVKLHPFELKDKTIEKAMKFLKPLGITNDDEFVLIHFREEGYVDGFQHGYRNLNPNEFMDCVDYFLQQGLKVIRIGHSKMTEMGERIGFIDLTRARLSDNKPPEVDIFLCGAAKFYFGSGSGPFSLALNFGVLGCEINRIGPIGGRPNHFAKYVKFKDKQNDKGLKFSDIISKNLQSILAPQCYENAGLEPSWSSSLDNLQFAKECLEYFNKGNIFQLNKDCELQREKFNIWGGLDSSSLLLLD